MSDFNELPGATTNQLLLLSGVPGDFNPETDWLDGDEPAHPFFDDPSLEEKPELWRAILSAQQYGVIYLVSRSEARQYFQPLIEEHPAEGDIIDSFRRQDAVAIRVINYGVHRDRPLFDLHDFAHFTTATLSPELFGNKYFDHLIKLPASVTALIRSPGMKSGKSPKISDGVLLSEVTGIFTQEIDAYIKETETHTYKSLTETLANQLADYLLGRRDLLHLSTQKMIQLDEPITPTELAVLAQNKAYELPASEIEQRCFTRGGSDESNPLFNKTTRQRIDFLATSRSWTYFEVRNTVKHRAHKEAYRLVAMQFVENGVEMGLCREILENITYKDYRAGERVDLWGLLV